MTIKLSESVYDSPREFGYTEEETTFLGAEYTKSMTIKLSESGYDTGMTFEEVCDLIEKDGYDSPREFGYTEEETTFLGAEYTKSEIDKNWETDVPYWYAK